MKQISLEELADCSESFDAAVMRSGDIDLYCSSTDWIVPACLGLMPEREPYIFTEDGHYWAFMRSKHPGGFPYLEPLEAMWALACPAVGEDPTRLARGIEQLCEMPLGERRLMLLPGLPSSHPLLAEVISRLAGRFRIAMGDTSVRMVARLEDGVDAYLGRRSRGFRRALRRSRQKAEDAGIAVVDASDLSAEEAFARIIEVEKRGWKGRDDVGIVHGGMRDFYELMLPRLSARGGAQVRFATKDGRDIGYILGGLRGATYRGLQFSYDHDYASFSLGNIMQIEQMIACAAMGTVHYDLGMAMDYKERWADAHHETCALFIIRDGGR